jgi:tetratricopeptide (TPR) repeat protein
MTDRVKAWEEKVVIPTYPVGDPDRNPMFLEKRVYQGSSGVVYPHPVIDKVSDEKTDREYTALFLENEYLRVMILPELGGRVQMAYDKTNDYHFIYYNEVIKPALVGLTGPWISGGIEFNWPQHHRPSTFEPVDYTLVENEDGSATAWVSEIEIMFHTKGMAGFTLHPGHAYLEVTGQLYNRTPFPQSFLWWANPAVQVDEDYQSVFPPDVHAVYDHGRRDVSSFPIATGTYYKVDYSPGTDISRYNNIPVPTSYMAVNSNYDFVGGYHHGKHAGLLHVADHHVSPGKKQWTWGSGEFGRMWDTHLTDQGGPYFEIMTGVYTDNQPDFSWIMPNEERVFRQYFMPYKEAGYVKNANREAAVNLEEKEGSLEVRVYVTSAHDELRVTLSAGSRPLLDVRQPLSPREIFARTVAVPADVADGKMRLEVRDAGGRLLIAYAPEKPSRDPIPDAARPIGAPATLKTNEDLFLAATHLEQYRHATYSPVAYYAEALRRDPTDARVNNALGRWLVRHGQFEKSLDYFHRAIEKLTRHNGNPYDGEAYYNLGVACSYLERWDEAYDALFKSCWNAAWQDAAYLELAYIDCRRGDYEKALDHVDHSLARNYHGMKARHLKTILLRLSGRAREAASWARETLQLDAFDFGTRYEQVLLAGDSREAVAGREALEKLTRGWEHSYLEIAIDYAHAGLYAEALRWLEPVAGSAHPLVHYYRAYYHHLLGDTTGEGQELDRGASLGADRVFPNRLEDIVVLSYVTRERPRDKKAWYYLGNLWYDKRQYPEAVASWEQSRRLGDPLPTVSRNLAIAYFNKLGRPSEALALYEEAFQADPTDARVLFELDQLYKRMSRSVARRLAFLEDHRVLVEGRDDLYTEYVTLLNLEGRHGEAEAALAARRFHPWEGGEGKVSSQYVKTKVALATRAIEERDCARAVTLLEEALHYPPNLGEGKLYGAQENDVYYWLGEALSLQGDAPGALKAWRHASEGLTEPAPAIYYNDQPPESIFYQGLALRHLGDEAGAARRFSRLVAYGEAHLGDESTLDFFAVSLPDLTVFEVDLDARNRMHCHYLMGLGLLGLGRGSEALRHFDQVLKTDPAHQGATLHRAMTERSVDA